MKILVYIASPYTIGDKLENVNRQIDIADKLMNIGFAPVIPLYSHYQHIRHPRPYEDWMNLDYALLDRCDCVLRLSGKSKGADLETDYADTLGIPVFRSIQELTKYYTK